MIVAAARADARTADPTLTAEGDRLRWRGSRPGHDLLGELAVCLPATLAQAINEREKVAAHSAAEARWRLARVAHDRLAAGLLMAFWRHTRGTAT